MMELTSQLFFPKLREVFVVRIYDVYRVLVLVLVLVRTRTRTCTVLVLLDYCKGTGTNIIVLVLVPYAYLSSSNSSACRMMHPCMYGTVSTVDYVIDYSYGAVLVPVQHACHRTASTSLPVRYDASAGTVDYKLPAG